MLRTEIPVHCRNTLVYIGDLQIISVGSFYPLHSRASLLSSFTQIILSNSEEAQTSQVGFLAPSKVNLALCTVAAGQSQLLRRAAWHHWAPVTQPRLLVLIPHGLTDALHSLKHQIRVKILTLK